MKKTILWKPKAGPFELNHLCEKMKMCYIYMMGIKPDFELENKNVKLLRTDSQRICHDPGDVRGNRDNHVAGAGDIHRVRLAFDIAGKH